MFFLNSNFAAGGQYTLIYSNEDATSKRFKAKKYYSTKEIIDNYNVMINWKNFHDQPIDSDMKRYEEIRKLTTRQG